MISRGLQAALPSKFSRHSKPWGSGLYCHSEIIIINRDFRRHFSGLALPVQNIDVWSGRCVILDRNSRPHMFYDYLFEQGNDIVIGDRTIRSANASAFLRSLLLQFTITATKRTPFFSSSRRGSAQLPSQPVFRPSTLPQLHQFVRVSRAKSAFPCFPDIVLVHSK